MSQIILNPSNNRERQLVRDHGNVWELVTGPRIVLCFGATGELAVFIRSPDGTHERWVKANQVGDVIAK